MAWGNVTCNNIQGVWTLLSDYGDKMPALDAPSQQATLLHNCGPWEISPHFHTSTQYP